jgi:ubiquinone/menaquinone biosynthesis methyltransferase
MSGDMAGDLQREDQREEQLEAQREAGVRTMFDRIAGRYDLMNSVMSAGLHHRWRARAVELARVGRGGRALDVCCGTGDLALALRQAVGPGGEVVGLDFSEAMLDEAHAKSFERGAEVEWIQGNALELPFESASFDVATVGFGIRNVVDLPRALAEMRRVVRPGGRVVVLEITTPERPPLSWFYALWFDRVVPLLGTVAGDRDAYSYLPESVKRFPPAAGLAKRMHDGGLRDVRYLILAGGIVAIHAGTVEEVRSSRDRRAEEHAADSFEAVLDADGGALRALVERAEAELHEAASGHGAALTATSHETLAAGGKRLRPALVFVCGAGKNGDGGRPFVEPFVESLVRAAAAVELVHMATLVHDDVLDAALLRRGRPTVFASEGRGLATAAGDFLFSRAFALLAANGEPDQVRALSDASVALARGELEQREDAYATDIPLDRYLRRCELKTASLFSTACRLGGLAAERAAEEVTALAAYGRKVGVAFQMLDDLLDVSGPAERTGKHRGTDLLDGTVTLPLILAREADSSLAELDLRTLRREQAEAVCDRIAATGALERTREWARSLVQEGKKELRGKVDPDLERSLEEVADRVVERYS